MQSMARWSGPSSRDPRLPLLPASLGGDRAGGPVRLEQAMPQRQRRRRDPLLRKLPLYEPPPAAPGPSTSPATATVNLSYGRC